MIAKPSEIRRQHQKQQDHHMPNPCQHSIKTSTTTDRISEDSNITPSIIARQQRVCQSHSALALSHGSRLPAAQQNLSSSSGSRFEQTADRVSSHTADSKSPFGSFVSASMKLANESDPNFVHEKIFDKDGLIVPKRIVPHMAIGLAEQKPDRMRDLNRELKFNQTRGKNVLDQKSELKRAMEKLEMSRRKKEAESEKLSRRTSLEMRLEERAQRLARDGDGDSSGQPTPPTATIGTCKNSASGGVHV